ncbi:MAG: hypothetical protein HQ547_01770 [Candidatus Omnitrophica bacterium]|nr:hypothetical protein [Candidatus Omnitrophota bacterium]
MMKKISLLIVILLLATPVFAQDTEQIDWLTNYTPPPTLLNPISGEVVAAKGDVIRFRWSSREGSYGSRENYDFRLYKGYSMSESALMLEKRLPAEAYQFNVNTDRFEHDQMYTWAVRQTYSRIGPSEWQYTSFRVIKKQ